MDSFSQYAQVKDIRMIKDRNNSSSESYRDYGFIEFFSVEDATFVLDRSKQDRLKIKGQQISVSFSRFKKHEQYVTLKEITYVYSLSPTSTNRKASLPLAPQPQFH